MNGKVRRGWDREGVGLRSGWLWARENSPRCGKGDPQGWAEGPGWHTGLLSVSTKPFEKLLLFHVMKT